ncbi:MAG: N-acetylmuramoyl-L-alanine amidase-like domain-containing protein [Pseudomonadota bacterium]
MLQLLILLLLSPPAQAKTALPDFSSLRLLSNEELLRDIKIHQCTEAQLDRLLPELHRRYPDFLKRLAALAALYTGAPYITDPLTDEAGNWLPYDKTNCTMFVLYAAAFANSRSYHEALRHMRQLHYRQGNVGFTARYHFTEDRITDPENIYFTSCTERFSTTIKALKQISVQLNIKQDGSFLFGDRLGTWSKKVTLRYIPRAGFQPAMLKNLPEVIGVAFVKKSNWSQGLIVGHEGLLINGDLYHSSPDAGVCIKKNFLHKEFSHSLWEGLILYTIHEVK